MCVRSQIAKGAGRLYAEWRKEESARERNVLVAAGEKEGQRLTAVPRISRLGHLLSPVAHVQGFAMFYPTLPYRPRRPRASDWMRTAICFSSTRVDRQADTAVSSSRLRRAPLIRALFSATTRASAKTWRFRAEVLLSLLFGVRFDVSAAGRGKKQLVPLHPTQARRKCLAPHSSTMRISLLVATAFAPGKLAVALTTSNSDPPAGAFPGQGPPSKPPGRSGTWRSGTGGR